MKHFPNMYCYENNTYRGMSALSLNTIYFFSFNGLYDISRKVTPYFSCVFLRKPETRACMQTFESKRYLNEITVEVSEVHKLHDKQINVDPSTPIHSPCVRFCSLYTSSFIITWITYEIIFVYS